MRIFAHYLERMTTGYDNNPCDFPQSSLPRLIAGALKDNWDRESLQDYKGSTLLYSDVARIIARLHILFDQAGIAKGDRIAICGRNSSNWAISCLAAMTYGAVTVPILHEFKPDSIHHIINHSEARLFFAAGHIWESLDTAQMTLVQGIIGLDNLELLWSRDNCLEQSFQQLDSLFEAKYHGSFTKAHVTYPDCDLESLAMINYTSGSTGFSKGVMLPYRSILNNRLFAGKAMYTFQPGYPVLSMLPMAHMYGFSFEFFYEFTMGCHIYFLTRTPSPKIIFKVLGEIRPRLIVSVPLVIEKIVRKNVMPKLETPTMRLLVKVPFVRDLILGKVRKELVQALGGRFYEVIIGGAALNREVEQVLAHARFPYTVGYGATECGPIITYQDKDSFIPGSCGKAVSNMEVRILSDDPQNVAGEIVCRGPNVMLGYYKNPELTARTIDADGWLHTGDLGVIDRDGNLYIKGRSKNLLLGPSGQNIYPEEIEDILNNMPLVGESLVIQEDDKLIALVYADQDTVQKQGYDSDKIAEILESDRQQLNSKLPAYEQILEVRIQENEFEKTPKKSIKRFLYQK